MEKAREKLEAAKDLLEDKHYSDALSRAYYSMFFAARALLSTKDIYPKTHRGVIPKIAEEYVKTGELSQDTFRDFATTQEEREKADYGIISDISKADAEEAITAAEKLIEDIKKLL
ncbi:MAG: HEPN domain-containing protein [Candidatus Altiarchaeota archaeon]|nr:HEPN domain-containing protein [Candidatus Altiarchaeota archaeon]